MAELRCKVLTEIFNTEYVRQRLHLGCTKRVLVVVKVVSRNTHNGSVAM